LNINELASQNKSETQKQILDFTVFYSVFLFYLIESLFLSNLEFKKDVYEILINNVKVVVANNLEKLLSTTIKYEEVSLTNKDLFIFFEISVSCFSKIKSIFNNILDFNFYYIFIPQYVQLMAVIEKSGIFNENLLYLIRTLPLLDVNLF